MNPEAADIAARRPGARRLIEWTGERCVPWAPDAQVVYEHLHRYLWASALVAGKRVLDLASGEGFGAAILAGSAALVAGVDIDELSVEHASENYAASNLSFAVADARELAAFADDAFDVVVAFEMIEHVAEQDRILAEIARVLAADGLLVMSTPDHELYQEMTPDNPFHVRELGAAEFDDLLHTRFANVAVWGQRTITGSVLHSRGSSEALPESTSLQPSSFFIERSGEEWRRAAAPSPVYLVAVASNSPLPQMGPDSVLGDAGLQLVRVAAAEAAERAAAAAEQQRLRERRATERHLQDVKARHDAELQRLRARAAHDSHTIATLQSALNAAERRNLRIEGSVTWQLFQRVRGKTFALLGGEDSAAVAAIQRTLRFVGRRLRGRAVLSSSPGAMARHATARARSSGPIVLPGHDDPDVSIIIPLYAHAELTRAALESIRDHTLYLGYEVILVDDSEDAPTKALLRQVRGARIIVNESNLGYIRSIEAGAAAARGRWLVLANNDIEVQPGWLAAMLDCAESAPDIGIVAPKFVYPDGRLAEAGGIMWRDATGANYGRGGDPTSCHYEYRREVDYGSAAALMVRASFWRDVGGFDKRFLPMYYEDTDLCFEARAHGLRVMYEPTAQIIHVEGASAGTDESAGHKRHQEENRPKFQEKWRDRLEHEHLPNDQGKVWVGANLRRRPHVLVVDHRVPMWDRDSGSLRMRAILELLLELGAHVVFLPDNLMPMQPYTRELQRMGVEVLYGVDVATELELIGPHLALAVLSRPQAAARWLDVIREHAPQATIAYDTVDLHWLREARKAATEQDSQAPVLSPKAATMRELELALIRASDATIVVTDEEREQVEADVPGSTVHVLPNVNRIRSDVPPASARGGLLFVGGFEHPPNADAVLTLVQDVMPLVWAARPGVHVTIVGADPPPEVSALAGENVEIAGWVPDLDPLVSSSRALIAPLRYGAGMKGKVTQSLADGLPVVTTAFGAEGLEARDGVHLLIGNTPHELADKVLRVLGDDELWERLSAAGRELAAERCSPQLMAARLSELLDGAATPGKLAAATSATP